MADKQPDASGFRVYLALTGGTWIDVPLVDQAGNALLISDVGAKIPLGVTRVYVKAIADGAESEAKMRTLYRQSISLALPTSARITESFSWW